MIAREDRSERRERIDELLQEIDAQRRRQLLLEASGVYAPGLELQAAQTQRQLEELVR
jgi:hypothetical protein